MSAVIFVLYSYSLSCCSGLDQLHGVTKAHLAGGMVWCPASGVGEDE